MVPLELEKCHASICLMCGLEWGGPSGRMDDCSAGKIQRAWQSEVIKSPERFTVHCGHFFFCGSHEHLVTYHLHLQSKIGP